MLKNTGIFVAYLVVFWIALPLLLIIVGEAASSLYPIALPNHPFLYFCGILLIASGGALFFLSSKQLAEQGQGLPVSHIHPRKLVRSGPYRYLRHPIYVGYTLLWAGFACLVGSFWMLTISLLLLIAGWLLYAHYFEEKILQRRFGDQYTSYRNKTPIILIKPDRRK
ncbi:MAG: methyltransferase family protein [bacterium]